MNQTPTHRILVVDDQAAIHDDYRKVLGKQAAASTAALDMAAAQLFGDDPAALIEWEGFEIDSAFQGQDGLELVERAVAERRPYAMAFVDIRMPPGWDGVETVRRIWEVDPEVLVVICSAYSDYSWQEMVRELGRNDRYLILRKPFDNIEVRQCAMALTERWAQSRTDVLTGLLNRRAFESYLNAEWLRSERHHLPLACAMLDLDWFKRVNDSFGHQAGDRVLKHVAQILLSRQRASDSIYRYGGEEIFVLLPHTSEQDAVAWAESVRRTIEATPIAIRDRQLTMTASIGVADRSASDDRPEQLIDRADQALIAAKTAGRNRVVAHSSNCSAVAPVDNVWANVSLSEVMSSPVIGLKSSTTIRDAARFFTLALTTSAAVVDGDGRMFGVVSAQELLAVPPTRDWQESPIERIARQDIELYDESTPVHSIVAYLKRATVGGAFVVRDGRPIGVISRGNLLRHRVRLTASRDEVPITAGLVLGGQFDRGRLAQCAQRLAGSAADMLKSSAAPPRDASQLPLAEIAILQTLSENAWAFLLGDNSPPILAPGPDFSGIVAPISPLTPMG